MAGYYNYSMSNNAVWAYENGEMPLSKWTKSSILEACGDKAEMLKPLTVAELRAEVLICSSWHHTSKHYNRTDFYMIDVEKLSEITNEDVATIVARRQPKQKAVKAERKTVKAEVTFTVWVGQYRNYRRPKTITEVVKFTEGDKMVETSCGKKRMSSMERIRIIED